MNKKFLGLFLLLIFLLCIGCTSKRKSTPVLNSSAPHTSLTETSTHEGQAITTAVTNSTTVKKSDNKSAASATTNYSYQRTHEPRHYHTTINTVYPAVAVGMKNVGDMMVSPITNKTYKLKWIDDFTGTSLNNNNWTVITDNDYTDLGINLKDNVSVNNSNLSITAHKLSTPAYQNNKTYDYSSGEINSKGKVRYRYGRIEAYCKPQISKGVNSAFWTLGDYLKSEWPWCGEIDIFILFGNNKNYSSGITWADPETYNENIDIRNRSEEVKREDGGYGFSGSSTLADEYHVYGMEWTDTNIYFYFDGYMFENIKFMYKTQKSLFYYNHFLIFNVYLTDLVNKPDAGAVFPQTLKVDWVKVWQEK